jgi:hypothetical protein
MSWLVVVDGRLPKAGEVVFLRGDKTPVVVTGVTIVEGYVTYVEYVVALKPTPWVVA